MEKTIEGECTEDFWNITLPNRMETSSATSPILYAYNASLNLLHAKVLFSHKRVVDLLDPTQKGDKAAAERHHLFAKKYLKDKGITGTRDTKSDCQLCLG